MITCHIYLQIANRESELLQLREEHQTELRTLQAEHRTEIAGLMDELHDERNHKNAKEQVRTHHRDECLNDAIGTCKGASVQAHLYHLCDVCACAGAIFVGCLGTLQN